MLYCCEYFSIFNNFSKVSVSKIFMIIKKISMLLQSAFVLPYRCEHNINARLQMILFILVMHIDNQ